MSESINAEDPPVTIIAVHRVKLGKEKAFEQTMSGLLQAAMSFEGHLEFFQLEARFPEQKNEVPKPVVIYLAKQVGVPFEEYHAYDWQGRNIKYHRAQIRFFWVFAKLRLPMLRRWLIG